MVLQDNVLFSGTVLDNLRLARPDASKEALIAAAHDLDVHEVIERLPHGYDTEVGPLGSHLSHGQRQLRLPGAGLCRQSGDPDPGRGNLGGETSRRSAASSGRCAAYAKAAPPSLSPIAWRPSAMPTASP